MRSLAFTLVADGSSDRVLVPLIQMLMDEHSSKPFVTRFAEALPRNAKTTRQRIEAALSFYPCDLLFVHRDAESADVSLREEQIRVALEQSQAPAVIFVIPVRMTKAWLLTDEVAIRAAVGNPRGVVDLDLPVRERIEAVDAKQVLFRALETAKDLGARRRSKFKPEIYRHRVAELLTDLQTLRQLTSFRHFEAQVSRLFSTGGAFADV